MPETGSKTRIMSHFMSYNKQLFRIENAAS